MVRTCAYAKSLMQRQLTQCHIGDGISCLKILISLMLMVRMQVVILNTGTTTAEKLAVVYIWQWMQLIQ